MGSRGRPLRRILPGATLLAALLLGLPSGPAPVGAEVRISNLSVFLNDYDVTVTIIGVAGKTWTQPVIWVNRDHMLALYLG